MQQDRAGTTWNERRLLVEVIALTLIVVNTVLLDLVARAILAPAASRAVPPLPALPVSPTALLPYLGAVLVFATVSWLIGWRAEQRNREHDLAREQAVAHAREQHPEIAEQLGHVSERALAMWPSHDNRGPAAQRVT